MFASVVTGAVDAASSSEWRRAVRQSWRSYPGCQVDPANSKGIASLTIYILTTITLCLEKPFLPPMGSSVGGARRMQLFLLSAQSLSAG
jgi:hypothetical protein